MATCLGSPFHLCCGEGGILQISLEYVGSTHSVWTTLGLPQLMAACAFPVYTAQAPVALQGNCLKWALGCVHFPGLSHSSSGTHKGTDSVGPAFCALPRSKKLRQPGTWQVHYPRWSGASYHLPSRSRLVSWVCNRSAVSGVLCVSSGELISGCDSPGRCQPYRIPGRCG